MNRRIFFRGDQNLLDNIHLCLILMAFIAYVYRLVHFALITIFFFARLENHFDQNTDLPPVNKKCPHYRIVVSNKMRIYLSRIELFASGKLVHRFDHETLCPRVICIYKIKRASIGGMLHSRPIPTLLP